MTPSGNVGRPVWAKAVPAEMLSIRTEWHGSLGRYDTGTVDKVATTDVREQLPIRDRLLRTACVGMPVAAAVIAVFVVTGVGGFRGGWLWAPLVAAPALAAVGWLGWGRHRGRILAAAALALGGIAIGMWDSQNAVLSHGRLRAAMESISLPSGFEHTSDEANGWSLCFDECTSYTRYWVATGSAEDVQAQLADVLDRDGFALGEWGTRRSGLGTGTAEGHRGRLRVLVGVDTRWEWKDGQRLTLAPDQVGVAVILGTYDGP